jgi:hypothetical protein
MADLLGKPGHQSGLADAGFAGYAQRDCIAGLGGVEGSVQTTELSCATDEVRGRDGPRHGEEYAPYGFGLEPAGGGPITHSTAASRHENHRAAPLSSRGMAATP